MLTLSRQVALGVYYLHCCTPPVLHLDLKSANVLLDYKGVAKLCDFGLSCVMEETAASAEITDDESEKKMGSLRGSHGAARNAYLECCRQAKELIVQKV